MTADSMMAPTDRLVDSFGRPHNNLRISVTDRCNIRCVYCMPEQVEFLPRAQLLTFEEIERFVRIAATLGDRQGPADRRRAAGPSGRAAPGREAGGDPRDQGHRADDQRHPAGACRPGTPGCRAGADQHQPGHDGPRQVRAVDATDRLRAGHRGDSGRQGGRVRPGEGQRRGHPGHDRGRRGPAGPVLPRAWAGTPIHRVHAARRRPPVGARQGPLRGRYPRDPDPRGRARWLPRPIRIRGRRRSTTITWTAEGSSASSPR